MSKFLFFLVVIEVILPVAIYLGRDRMIFLPSASPGPEAGLGFLRGTAEVELVRVRREDGRLLAAYDVRPRGAEASDLPVVIFFHGNAGNIAWRAPLAEDFAAGTRARTVLFDYSGYGGNAGSPSEEEVYRDGLAVYDHVAAGVDAGRIVLYGESLGGAVATAVAAERPVAGVVLQSSFSSLASMAFKVYPWMPLGALLARGKFPSAERLGEIDAPIYLVHGDRDGIVPFAESERLLAAAPAGTERLTIEGAGHNDLFEVGGKAYLERLREIFQQWTSTNS